MIFHRISPDRFSTLLAESSLTARNARLPFPDSLNDGGLPPSTEIFVSLSQASPQHRVVSRSIAIPKIEDKGLDDLRLLISFSDRRSGITPGITRPQSTLMMRAVLLRVGCMPLLGG